MFKISKNLTAAYLAAHYQIHVQNTIITLRIGEFSSELQQLHRNHGVETSLFITAWNPYSKPCTSSENEAAQAALKADLEAAGVSLLEGAGVDPSRQWPGEDSLIALGVSREAAIALGMKFGQNGVVWSDGQAVPELILLHQADSC